MITFLPSHSDHSEIVLAVNIDSQLCLIPQSARSQSLRASVSSSSSGSCLLYEIYLTMIEALASGGGFVFSTVHNIQAEVPARNVVAMVEALKEFGKY